MASTKSLTSASVLTSLPAYASAIVGEDSGSAFAALQLGPGQTLTTGTLALGDSGEASSLAALTAEIWFKGDSSVTPSFNMNIVCGPLPGAGAPQWQLLLNTTGTVTFGVHGAGAQKNVTSPTALLNGYWYHLVGAVENGFVRLYVNGTQVASTAWADTVVTGFTDGVNVGDPGLGVTIAVDELAFYRYGLPAARIGAHYDAGATRGFAQGLSDVRVGAVLDSIASFAPRRIVVGSTANASGDLTNDLLPEYMRGQPPLEAVENAVQGETVDAAFFTAADGTLTFLAANHRSANPYNMIQSTFGDQTGELAYLDLTLDYSDSFIANEWNVTAGSTGTTQTASDATSISRYGKRPQTLSQLPLVADTTAAGVASAMLAKYKDPIERVTQLTFSTLDPNVAAELFRRDLMDKIRVLRTPPAGGARISQDLWIQRIDVSGANDGNAWTVTWAVSPV